MLIGTKYSRILIFVGFCFGCTTKICVRFEEQKENSSYFLEYKCNCDMFGEKQWLGLSFICLHLDSLLTSLIPRPCVCVLGSMATASTGYPHHQGAKQQEQIKI